MSKKIVFIGPAGAGKTTLRKIFFEYEIAENLLQSPLDPTYGVESLVLKLGQNIGIFDLAGQENEKWLTTDEKEVFLDTTIILIIIDVTSTIPELEDFVKKVVHVRDDVCHDALIYLLVHKIDLLNEKDLENKKKLILARLCKEPRLKIEFTSITKDYFGKTFDIFRDIVKMSLNEEIILEQIDHEAIKNMLDILTLIKQNTSLLPSQMKDTLKLSDSQLASALTYLEGKGFVKRVVLNEKTVICLVPGVSVDFLDAVGSRPQEKFTGIDERYFEQALSQTTPVPPVIGLILANSDGLPFMNIEINPGVFQKFLGVRNQDDMNLIAPFVSALSHFSKEINVINMTDFRLRGQNMAISVLSIQNFQVTLFINRDINMDKIKDKIISFFTSMIANNYNRLMRDPRFGVPGSFPDLELRVQQWIVELNKTYIGMVSNLKIFDAEYAKTLFNKLEDISAKIPKDNARALEKTRYLKTRLVSAIMEKNIAEIREISQVSKDFEAMFLKK